MGNHLVGKMFVAGIATLSDKEIDELSQEQALEILDKIGKVVVESTSLDAEFDNSAYPNQRLGRVILKAFLPEKYESMKNDDDMNDEYYENAYSPFRERYNFW